MKKILKKLFKTSVLGIIMAIVFVASYVFASIPLGSNFQLNSQLPLDARTVVADVTARDAIPAGQRYQGLTVYVVSTATNYQLQAGITNSDWVVAAGSSLASNISGGLGGQILYQSAVDTTAKLTNGTAGQVLTSNGTTLAPSWATIASSPITIVNSSNLFSTGLTGTGSGVTVTTNSNFFGPNAGNAATGAYNSNFFGSAAGSGATGAELSNFLGMNAGTNASNAHRSNFLGVAAGSGATDAFYSNFIGMNAGNTASSSSYSNFIGYLAGSGATTAPNSNFIGYLAGNGAATASNSIFVGKNAGVSDTVNNTTNVNDWSILLGYNTKTGGFKNSILLGGASSATPISNTKANQFMLADTITDVRWRGIEYSLPSSPGAASTVLTNNGSGGLSWAAAGGGGLATNISGGLGGQVLYQSAVDTTAKLANGTAGQVLTSAGTTLAPTWTTPVTSPITIVNSSNLFSTGLTGTGNGVTAIINSNFFGPYAGYGATGASNSNFLGEYSGASATSAAYSNFFGENAGDGATSANSSNFLGYTAGASASSAYNSNFLGQNAGKFATSASNSNFLGLSAGANATNASNSIFIGQNAGSDATNASYSNLFGFQAGKSYAGNNIGSNNIIIGTNISLPNTTSNAMNLGGVLFATGTYANTTGNPSITAVSGGKVGIGTTTPGTTLHILAPSVGASTNAPVDVLTVEIGAPTSGSKLGYGPSILFKDAPGMYDVNNMARISAIYELGTNNTNYGGALSFSTNSDISSPNTLPSEKMRITNTGNVGIGITTPTAFLQLKAGTDAVNTAPLKLTSGTNLTTTEAGAIEYDGSHLYFTAVDSGTRYQLDQQGGGTPAITVVNSSNLFSTGLTGTGSGVTGTIYSNFFGENAGNGATSADYSNFLGAGAGNAASHALKSNFLGGGAGSSASFASSSNFLGYNAGSGATSASDSNFLGNSAGQSASDAASSNFIGTFAGNSATSASGSNFLGYYAGTGASSASNSNFIGYSAGGSATSASNSNFLGTSAGGSATSAAYSNFFGYNAGTGATSASNSIFIGKYAGSGDNVNNTGSLNDWSILLGYNTKTGGFKNSILLGGASSVTTISNTKANQFMLADTITDVRWRGIEYSLPSSPGAASTVLTNNGSGGLSWAAVSGVSSPITVVNTSNLFSTGLTGTGAGVTTINNSNFLGQNAGQGATSASQSNFLGYAAGAGATSASFSNFFGENAGYGATGANVSNFFGSSAGYQATSASNSNFLGAGAGSSAASADHSNFIGNSAGSVATNANDSNFLGSNAGYHATSAYYSNFLGTSAGNLATNASYSNFLGNSAGDGAHHASYSNFLGDNAGNGAFSSHDSNFMGSSAGISATSADTSNFFGQHAGDGATSASRSNFFGPYAGVSATTASNSNFFGGNAGSDASSASNSNFFGQYTGSDATSASNSNFFGYASGEFASNASYSNLFGFQTGMFYAGNNIGSNNIIIGTNVSLPNATANAMNLGGVLFATGTYSTTTGSPSITAISGGKVGIGVVAPSTILEIGSSDLGNGAAGPIITLGRNTNATNTGAGSINFLGKAGTAGYVWQDAAGNMRIYTSAPTNAGDTSGTVIGAQTSTRDTKTEIKLYTDYSKALAMVTNAPLNTFRYIKEVEGYGTNSPLAKTRIGFVADEVDPMFMVGNSIDQVSVNGLLMASIKELDLKVKALGTITNGAAFPAVAVDFFGGIVTSVSNGIAYMKNIVVDTLKIGSPEKPTGITLYDTTTGKPYCMSIKDGQSITTEGECKIFESTSDKTPPSGGTPSAPALTIKDKLQAVKDKVTSLVSTDYENYSTVIETITTTLELPEITDEDIIDKTTAITVALTELVPIESTTLSDLTVYNEALTKVTSADYTAESWTTYQAVVDANVMVDTKTQTEVDAATLAITTAQGSLIGLVKVPTCTENQTLVDNICTDHPKQEPPTCDSPKTLTDGVCSDPLP